MDQKQPWKSKTAWISLLIALSSFIPDVSGWVSEHSDAFQQAVGLLFLVLRFVSHDKIVIKDEPKAE
jgi:hypothetical protein